MKNLILLIVAGLSLGACNKHPDHKDSAGVPIPHVAGSWSGNGTDDAIGYYDIAVDILVQDGSSVAGTYTTSSTYGTTSGDFRATINPPNGGHNLTALTMTRTAWTGSVTCGGSMTLAYANFSTSSTMEFHYKVTDCRGTNDGGANLKKNVGTN